LGQAIGLLQVRMAILFEIKAFLVNGEASFGPCRKTLNKKA
jgi:hypothetical protein